MAPLNALVAWHTDILGIHESVDQVNALRGEDTIIDPLKPRAHSCHLTHLNSDAPELPSWPKVDGAADLNRPSVSKRPLDSLEVGPGSPVTRAVVEKSFCRWVSLLCRLSVCGLLILFPSSFAVCAIRIACWTSELQPLLATLRNGSPCHLPGSEVCLLRSASKLEPLGSDSIFATHSQQQLLGVLYLQIAGSDVEKMLIMLQGGHTSLEDPTSAVYQAVASMPDAYQRPSSHRSDVPQFGFDFRAPLRTFLIGRLGNTTWMQLEADPWSHCCHLLDFYMYAITGKNVGPFGFSAHTDKHPLVISTLSPVNSVCPRQCDGFAMSGLSAEQSMQVDDRVLLT